MEVSRQEYWITSVVAIPFSRGSSLSRDWTQVSCIAGRFFAIWTTRGVLAANKGPIRWTEPSLAELLELCVATGAVIVPDWSLSRLCGWWSHVNQLTSPEDLPDPGIKLRSPALQANSLPAELPGKPKNTEVGSLSLLQWIVSTQDSNRGLLHCKWILYQLSYQSLYSTICPNINSSQM